MYPDLYPIIRSHFDNFENQLFTSLPASVVDWDAKTQTITARPVMLEPYSDGVVAKLPVIYKVPVVFPSGGGGSLTFPLQEGDEVLLVFSARNYDTWWATGDVDELSSTHRFHEYTDAIAIVGLTSKDKSVEAHETDVVLKFKGSSISLTEKGNISSKVKNTWSVSNGTEELVSVLSEAIDLLSKATVGGVPLDQAILIAAVKIRLDTFKEVP